MPTTEFELKKILNIAVMGCFKVLKLELTFLGFIM